MENIILIVIILMAIMLGALAGVLIGSFMSYKRLVNKAIDSFLDNSFLTVDVGEEEIKMRVLSIHNKEEE